MSDTVKTTTMGGLLTAGVVVATSPAVATDATVALVGDWVLVETEMGLAMARVVTPVFSLPQEQCPKDLKPVIRKATRSDLERERKNREREKKAFEICLERIKARGLDMKLVRVEYMHDGSRAIFYYTAEQRVDFRELVKDRKPLIIEATRNALLSYLEQ